MKTTALTFLKHHAASIARLHVGDARIAEFTLSPLGWQVLIAATKQVMAARLDDIVYVSGASDADLDRLTESGFTVSEQN